MNQRFKINDRTLLKRHNGKKATMGGRDPRKQNKAQHALVNAKTTGMSNIAIEPDGTPRNYDD